MIDRLLFSSFTTLHDPFHSPGLVLARNLGVVLAIVFWLGLAYRVQRDARRRIANPFLVVVATLLGLAPPYIGPSSGHSSGSSCARSRPAPSAARRSSRILLACPVCTTVLRNSCATCRAPLEQLWQLCPYCLSPVGPAAVDLDAALTAEAKTITLVEDTIPLVPQTEQHAADA